ncbi:alpha-mannosidase [Tessaracoccus antarcticus]|uniref:Alpha-mannosidase n=1 Tax=Tessaracoccus antarcticus TaxID=2479848 RepID=A0A3M0FYK6_9ACTN|nr:glycoside hydrolase family 38 C-terminal domain-containing protein [Tessaracoccus antarcticus]RMB57820.1 alpha-mannosidase [Tessaracoccus antarcticus]
MYHSAELLEMRIDRFVRERLHPARELASAPVTITAWEAPDEPVPFHAVPLDDFEPFEIGSPWGKAWGTTWFHVTGSVPVTWDAEAADVELKIDLGFSSGQPGFQAEGLVWSPEGEIVKALEPLNNYVRLQAKPGDSFDIYIEAASNPDLGSQFVDFKPSGLGRKSTAPTDPLYSLRRMAIVHRDREVWELVADIWTLRGLVDELPTESPRRAAILTALETVVEVVDPFNVHATAHKGREALTAVLSSPAAGTAHTVFAVGHAHIDSAWLWPVRETIRKCARTFSNVLDLMDQDPDFSFACSSAQQFAWIRDSYPELFERIKIRVAEGRFIPVGGMWVESDTNMPGSEALARQFVEGKQFFIDEFGINPREVWLPDSFGYSGALPQIARAAGANYFLTQKISWNEVNHFPHHTFQWEGIDGTRIFTHFPPIDTYNSTLSGGELAHAERNFRDKRYANTSLAPFGFGDGGGGPTREMIAAAHRTASLEGSPKVVLGTPKSFFETAEAEFPKPPVWAGELYLEFHRGTYTSQARTKRGNRRSEHLLHEAELWATTAAIRLGARYPYDELKTAWQLVLLQQFHDILPGTSIGWVHDQAVANYTDLETKLGTLIDSSLSSLTADQDPSQHVLLNSAPMEIDGVPAFGAATITDSDGVTLTQEGGDYIIDNGLLRVVLDENGLITSLIDLSNHRETVPPGQKSGLLQMFRDTPTQWDAWDVDIEYRRSGKDLAAADSVSIIADEAGRAALRTVRTAGSSTITQTISLCAGRNAVDYETHVDWHERQQMLKLAFPIDVHTAAAASEIQFGHIVRPTHTNTSWDSARFETPAHRWVHVTDATFGAGIANDSTYGHDITRHARDGGGTYSLVRQTLLKAPLFPDPEADQGEHTLRSAIVVGGINEAIRHGYRLNLPLRQVEGAATDNLAPLISSDSDAVLVETVKLAEDRSGDVVIRLYESLGSRANARIRFHFPHSAVIETDLLEEEVAAVAIASADDTSVTITMRPFQLVTLRVTPA